MGFLKKKINFFETRLRWQICCTMRIKCYYFVKMSFLPYPGSFFGKKSENFEIWKS